MSPKSCKYNDPAPNAIPIQSLSRLRLTRRNRLSQTENPIHVLTWKSNNRYQNIVKKGEIAPKEQFLIFSQYFL